MQSVQLEREQGNLEDALKLCTEAIQKHGQSARERAELTCVHFGILRVLEVCGC